MKQMLAFVLVILCFAGGRSSGIITQQQNAGQPAPGSSGWSPTQPPEPPAIDVSSEVRLTIAATKDQYEQLEPIKLRVELTNFSEDEITFKDVSECRIIRYEIVDMTRNVAVVDLTKYGKLNDNKPGRGQIALRHGNPFRISAYPNLCIDMTAPALYSIVATMELKRTTDGRRCMTRSKAVRVEVTPLLKGR
jgi:hypothetical protein